MSVDVDAERVSSNLTEIPALKAYSKCFASFWAALRVLHLHASAEVDSEAN